MKNYNSQYYKQFAVPYEVQLLLKYKIQQAPSLGRKQERKAFDQEMKMTTSKHDSILGRKKEQKEKIKAPRENIRKQRKENNLKMWASTTPSKTPTDTV